VKSHYDLLNVDPAADAETIKKAFRHEIARYHPDKVMHLGAEFQNLASTRAAELTTAYKTLTDPDRRSEYDATLRRPSAPAAFSPSPMAPWEPLATDPGPSGEAPHVRGDQFANERAGRDDIMRRAVLARVRDVMMEVAGECNMTACKGFDLACLSPLKPSLFRRSVPPSVLVRLSAVVDAPAATVAWNDAVKLRVQQRPLVLLLIGHEIAPAAELGRAIETQRRRHPRLHDTMFPVAVDSRDWTARVPTNAPESVKALIKRLRNYTR
jgi:curved DNA-binding protein CbpA